MNVCYRCLLVEFWRCTFSGICSSLWTRRAGAGSNTGLSEDGIKFQPICRSDVSFRSPAILRIASDIYYRFADDIMEPNAGASNGLGYAGNERTATMKKGKQEGEIEIRIEFG